MAARGFPRSGFLGGALALLVGLVVLLEGVWVLNRLEAAHAAPAPGRLADATPLRSGPPCLHMRMIY